MPRSLLTAVFCICGLVCLVSWYAGKTPLPVFAENGEQAQATEVAEEGAEQTPAVTPVWDSVNTTGVEEELVETIFDADKDGWKIVGERGFGIAMYGAPEFQVPMRKWEDIPMFPCSDCHKKLEINYTPRKLKEKHDLAPELMAYALTWSFNHASHH